MEYMTRLRNKSARIFFQLIWRNPFYLLSALLMALGVRLFLVGPNDPAGDVQLILVTLFTLQAYEWAVGSILIALHRARRSPEDMPYLLLIGAIFWTGPMAATVEMMAVDQVAGLGLAIAASIIAFGELRVAIRLLRFRISLEAQLVCAACLTLLTAIPPLMYVGERGTEGNEVLLYLSWWILSSFPLILLVPGTRRHLGASRLKSTLIANFAFPLFVVVVTGVQFFGVAHGFLCHARMFYVAPLLLTTSMLCMHLSRRVTPDMGWLTVLGGVLPILSIGLALQRFSPEFPLDQLPPLLRNPSCSVGLAAALAYWVGFYWHRRILFLHAGMASMAIAVVVGGRSLAALSNDTSWYSFYVLPTQSLVAFGLYGTSVYFLFSGLIRRSRCELLACVVTQLLGLIALMEWQTPVNQLFIGICAGWSLFAAIHIVAQRAPLMIRMVPIVVLIGVTVLFESTPGVYWHARLHAAAMLIILLSAGILWRWTRYLSVSLFLMTGFCGLYAVRVAKSGPAPTAMLICSGAFLLLTLGAILSWYKPVVMTASHRWAGGHASEET